MESTELAILFIYKYPFFFGVHSPTGQYWALKGMFKNLMWNSIRTVICYSIDGITSSLNLRQMDVLVFQVEKPFRWAPIDSNLQKQPSSLPPPRAYPGHSLEEVFFS